MSFNLCLATLSEMGSTIYQPSHLHHLQNTTLRAIEPRKLLLPTLENQFDDEIDLYSSDHFRMYDFKITKCTQNRNHDWLGCPFAHPGEKGRRRDPRTHNYSGQFCPEFRHGGRCSRGDKCHYSHGVFESWLHPSRYRTEVCMDGKKCLRKICFFAHIPRQLRVLPVKEIRNKKSNCQWRPCRTISKSATNFESSPNTILNGRSNFSSQLSHESSLAGINPTPGQANLIQKNSLGEFNRLYDAMNLNKASNYGKSVSFNASDRGKRIVISAPPKFNRAPGAPCTSKSNPFLEEKYGNDDGFLGPKFGWVNDLLT